MRDTPAPYCHPTMHLEVDSIVAYQGTDFRVESIVAYHLAESTLRLARMVGAGQARFLEIRPNASSDRVLLLDQIDNLDVGPPLPETIYHLGASYLLKLSGTAAIESMGAAPGLRGPCRLWRYRAAGDQYLQIEEWPDRIRTLAGPAVHADMLEVRPAM